MAVRKPPVQDQKTPSIKKLRVVRGKKKSHRIVILSILLILALAFTAFEIYTPTGIYEYIQNAYALTTDTGSDTMADQNATVRQFESSGNAIYLLSSSYFEIYNNRGKNVLYFKHGFGNPVMESSEARVLVYDRGGRTYKIFNYSTVLFEGTADGKILAADIARNGTTAIVSTADGYAAELYVAGKDQKEKMRWYSNANLLTAVCLRESGGKVAISEVFTANGTLSSAVSVFNFGDQSPQFRLTFDGEMISTLMNCNGKLIAASDKNVYVVDWKNKNNDVQTIETEGVLTDLECNRNGNLMMVSAREDRETHHIVKMFDKKFQCKATVALDAALVDIRSDSDAICTVFDNRLMRYDWEGNLLEAVTEETNIQRITYVGNRIAALGTSKISIR